MECGIGSWVRCAALGVGGVDEFVGGECLEVIYGWNSVILLCKELLCINFNYCCSSIQADESKGLSVVFFVQVVYYLWFAKCSSCDG